MRIRKMLISYIRLDHALYSINYGIDFLSSIRYEFHLSEDEVDGCYQLEVDCPRFMDTSLIDCDIQPTYVRVTIKGKVSDIINVFR